MVQAPVAKAALTVVSRSVHVTPARVAAVELRCGGAPCKGRLVLTAKLVLGSRSVAIPSGRGATVAVRLTPAAFTLLLRARTLVAQARVTWTQTAAETATTSKSVTPIAPRR